LPEAVTLKAVPALLNLFEQPVNVPGERNWMAGLKRLAQAVRVPENANMIRWSSYFQEDMKAALWKKNAGGFESTVEWMRRISESVQASGRLDQKLGTDILTYLPGDLLVKADRMTMAHSLEGRSPFLDHEFAGWAARLPENMKLRGRTSKYLLKKAAKKLLSPKVLNKGKQGFGIPVGAWFRGPLASWTRERLLQEDAAINDYFKPDSVRKLFKEHEEGRTNHGNKLWTLIMLELWLNKYKPVMS
jgi:asparagine synthase (glutamine-hydrolysing)